MNEYLTIAQDNQFSAQEIIKSLRIVELFESINCEVNLVGSLRMGLLMKHLDIDFHVYSTKVSIEESFSIILKLIRNPSIKKFTFKNLLNTEENCIEWHLFYNDKYNRQWQIDIIHMPKNSKYYGYFENIADRILLSLTENLKNTILKLKYETPNDTKILGIEYYQAVIGCGITEYKDLIKWKDSNSNTGIITWTP